MFTKLWYCNSIFLLRFMIQRFSVFTLPILCGLSRTSSYQYCIAAVLFQTNNIFQSTMSGKVTGTKSIRSFFTTTPSNNKKQRVEDEFAVVNEAVATDELKEDDATPSTVQPVDSSKLSADNNTAQKVTLSSDSLGWQPFDTMEHSWKERLTSEYHKPYFQRLLAFLQSEVNKGATIFPPAHQIFTALNLCPYDKVKVVVIGQDPYHGPGQAHGLAFSVQKGVQIPPSLRNMINEAMNDPKVHISSPSHGNLECWSTQGVLMLNTALTVRKGEANSHQKKGWEEFTDAIVRELKKRDGLVYLLWGKPAQTKCSGIDHKKNVVLTCSHPSPLSAYKTNEPFIGSRIFSRCNDALVELGKEPIDWNIR